MNNPFRSMSNENLRLVDQADLMDMASNIASERDGPNSPDYENLRDHLEACLDAMLDEEKERRFGPCLPMCDPDIPF